MKSSFKVITIGALVAIACFGFFSNTEVPASAAGIESSGLASAYATNCARCHGADGRSDTAKGRELNAYDLTTAISAELRPFAVSERPSVP